MQTIKRSTLETILKCFEASSKDETRINLNTVRLGMTKNQQLVESCDGHILARHYINEPKLNLENDLLIDSIGKTRIKNFLKEYKYANEFLLEIEKHNHIKLFTTKKNDGIILPLVFREYPKTDSVIPKRESGIEISFNPELLIKLYKSLNGEKRHPKVKFIINKDTPDMSPILVESGKDNLGVLMPIKG